VADDDEEDEERERPSRPPARHPGRLVAAAALVIVVGGGAVWIGTSSAPASQTTAYDASIPPAQSVPSPAPQCVRADTAAAAVETPPPEPPREPVRRRPEPVPVKRALAARRTTPAASPPPRRVERPAPPPPAEPALLSVNSVPWGSVYVDGQPVGNTPQIDLQVASGSHLLRVERDGFRPYERKIELASGQRLRITDIALVER